MLLLFFIIWLAAQAIACGSQMGIGINNKANLRDLKAATGL